jgi:glycosyltransferase involved in cell wall biosynthesis
MTHQSNLNWKERLRRPFYRLVDSLADRLADGRLAITQRLADAIHIPEEKLWGIWPSGVDIDLFTSGQNSKCWPSEGEPIHLIYIGVLHYERNLLTLSHAVERANSEGMSFTFAIVGDGAQRMELEEFASRTDGRIRLIPSVPHQCIPEMLAQAHIGVLPFPDEEKFRVSSPIKLFEYMAAGLPILATRIVSHTDVVGNGKYVFWADGADEDALLAALLTIWDHYDVLSDMGRDASIAIHAWTWQESAIKMSKAIEFGLAEK